MEDAVLPEVGIAYICIGLLVVSPFVIIDEIPKLVLTSRLEGDGRLPDAFLLVELHGVLLGIPIIEIPHDRHLLMRRLGGKRERHSDRFAFRTHLLLDHLDTSNFSLVFYAVQGTTMRRSASLRCGENCSADGESWEGLRGTMDPSRHVRYIPPSLLCDGLLHGEKSVRLQARIVIVNEGKQLTTRLRHRLLQRTPIPRDVAVLVVPLLEQYLSLIAPIVGHPLEAIRRIVAPSVEAPGDKYVARQPPLIRRHEDEAGLHVFTPHIAVADRKHGRYDRLPVEGLGKARTAKCRVVRLELYTERTRRKVCRDNLIGCSQI